MPLPMRRLLLAAAATLAVACGDTNGMPEDAGAGSGGSGSGGGGSGGGGSGGGGACAPACGEARDCCDSHCVNLQNDPQHCGSCDAEPCGDAEYCTQGRCSTPPCTTSCDGGASCCGSSCCGEGELCCDPQGPIDTEPRCLPPNEHGTCPMGCAPLCICADPETPIATPGGERAIAELQVGDLVYSIDRGQLAVVPIARIHRTEVVGHQVVRVALQTGAVLLISPGHPTADGRLFADLKAGDMLDGVAVTSAELVPFTHDATHDILPASDTHAYFAASVLIGSTLSTSSVRVATPTAPFDAPGQ